MEKQKAHSRLCHGLFGEIIKWIDDAQFIVLCNCREILANKKYWRIEDGK